MLERLQPWWANPKSSVSWHSRQAVKTLADWRGKEQGRKRTAVSFAQDLSFIEFPVPFVPPPPQLLLLSHTSWGKEEAHFSARLFNANDVTDGFGGSEITVFLILLATTRGRDTIGNEASSRRNVCTEPYLVTSYGKYSCFAEL